MKPEARFVNAVNSKLPLWIHKQSMAFTMTNGTPDQYYDIDYHHPKVPSFIGEDLWVEYKWLDQPPVRKFTPKPTDLQKQWLSRRHYIGGNAWVIVGFPTKKDSVQKSGFILTGPEVWEREVDPRELRALSALEIAKEIQARVCPSSI